MKKILCGLLLVVFLFSGIWLANAKMIMWEPNGNYLAQNVESSKKAISDSKYVTVVDKLIAKNAENIDLLKKMKSKLPQIKASLKNISNTENRENLTAIINYLEAKIDLAIYEIKSNVLRKFENIKLSEAETKKVEDELVKLQLNLLENWISKLQNITDEFDEISNYEAKWDLKVNLDVDHESIWKIKANLELSDYTEKASNFDSQVKWKIKALIEAAPKWEEAVKLELSSMMDFISKDDNMYLLLDQLNVSQENMDQIKGGIEVLEKIAKEKGYVKFGNMNGNNPIEILKNLNPNNILKDGKVALSKPMFKPYKKEGDRYYLIPTKYACDTMKELLQRFDPFGGKTCTESQYNNVLETLAERWEIYIEIWEDTKFWYEFTNKKSETEKAERYIIFSNQGIKEISYTILRDQEKHPNEWVIFNYIKNEKLDFNFYHEAWKIDFDFKSTLDRKNNKFTIIDYTWYVNYPYENLKSSLTLKNKILKWNFLYEDKRSSDEVGNIIEANLTWKMDYNNKLSVLDIDYSGLLDRNTNLTWKLHYNEWKFAFAYNMADERNEFNVDLSWDWDLKNKTLTAWESDIYYKYRNRIYHETSIEDNDRGYEYWDFIENFNSNIKLENKKISGETVIKNYNNENIISIKHSGNHEKNYLEFNNEFDINPELFGTASKARDSKRMSDIYMLESSLEQAYMDDIKYPSVEEFEEKVSMYMYAEELPTDPLWAVEIDWCKFGYIYKVWENQDWYELSTCLENEFYNWEKTYKEIKINTYWEIDCWVEEEVLNEEEYNEVEINMEEDYIENCDVEKDELNMENPSEIYINWYTSWKKREAQTETTITWDLNLKVDARNDKNNANVYFDLVIDQEKTIELEIDNKWTVEYKDVEIETPENVVPIEEIIWSGY